MKIIEKRIKFGLKPRTEEKARKENHQENIATKKAKEQWNERADRNARFHC